MHSHYPSKRGSKRGSFWDPSGWTPDPDPETPIWTRFGAILDPSKPPKSAQFQLFSMLLHMYNMYLYAHIHIHICIICINTYNMGYEGYPMEWLWVVMGS